MNLCDCVSIVAQSTLKWQIQFIAFAKHKGTSTFKTHDLLLFAIWKYDNFLCTTLFCRRKVEFGSICNCCCNDTMGDGWWDSDGHKYPSFDNVHAVHLLKCSFALLSQCEQMGCSQRWRLHRYVSGERFIWTAIGETTSCCLWKIDTTLFAYIRTQFTNVWATGERVIHGDKDDGRTSMCIINDFP